MAEIRRLPLENARENSTQEARAAVPYVDITAVHTIQKQQMSVVIISLLSRLPEFH
jgi:hypothetical protein